MFPEKIRMREVVEMTQVFLMENNHWPAHAADLLRFSAEWKRTLDLSEFHLLTFSVEHERVMVVKFALRRQDSPLAVFGRIEIKRIFTEGGTTFTWRKRYFPLTVKRVESRAYCPVPQTKTGHHLIAIKN